MDHDLALAVVVIKHMHKHKLGNVRHAAADFRRRLTKSHFIPQEPSLLLSNPPSEFHISDINHVKNVIRQLRAPCGARKSYFALKKIETTVHQLIEQLTPTILVNVSPFHVKAVLDALDSCFILAYAESLDEKTVRFRVLLLLQFHSAFVDLFRENTITPRTRRYLEAGSLVETYIDRVLRLVLLQRFPGEDFDDIDLESQDSTIASYVVEFFNNMMFKDSASQTSSDRARVLSNRLSVVAFPEMLIANYLKMIENVIDQEFLAANKEDRLRSVLESVLVFYEDESVLAYYEKVISE